MPNREENRYFIKISIYLIYIDIIAKINKNLDRPRSLEDWTFGGRAARSLTIKRKIQWRYSCTRIPCRRVRKRCG